MAFATHDYASALSHARAAYELVAEGAALAGAPAAVVEPSTWTVIESGKKGNGPNRANVEKADVARDLDEQANVKRVFSK